MQIGEGGVGGEGRQLKRHGGDSEAGWGRREVGSEGLREQGMGD
jgi:hypothetical protein